MPTPYVKQTWIDGVAGATPISAARLTYIEDGIENATVEDGTYEDKVGVGIEEFGGGLSKTAAENKAAIEAAIASFVGQEAYVSLPKGSLVCDPPTLISGAEIRGTGLDTRVTFSGDVTPWDLSNLSNVKLRGVRTIVDPTNTKAVILLAGVTSRASGHRLQNLWIDSTQGAGDPSPSTVDGQFTGIHVLSDGKPVQSCYGNDITINNAARGIVLEANAAATNYISFLNFSNIEVRTFAVSAFDLIEKPGSFGILENNFALVRIQDWVQKATTRYGLRLSGYANHFTDVQTFFDGLGQFFTLDLDAVARLGANARSHGNRIVGSIEGQVIGEQYLRDHTVDVAWNKRNGPHVAGTAPNIRRTTARQNLLPHTTFRSDTAHGWTLTNATAAIGAANVGDPVTEKATVTKTTAAGAGAARFSFGLSTADRDTCKSQWVTFTAALRSSAATNLIRVILQDGVSSRFGQFYDGQGDVQVCSVSMRVASTATIAQASIDILTDADVGTAVDVLWVAVNHGFGSATQPDPPRRDRQYVAVADDKITVSAGEMAAGPSGTPVLGLVGTYFAGWLLDSAITENVGLNAIIPPAWTTAKVTAWFANTAATAGNCVFRLVSAVNKADGSSTAGAVSGSDVTPTFASNSIEKVELANPVTVTAGTLQLLAVERRGAEAGDTLANDVALLAVEIQRVT